MKKDLEINEEEKLAAFGGVFKTDKKGNRVIAFASVTVAQDALIHVSTLKDINGFIFYYCSFNNTNFGVLNTLNVSDISILHGNFGDHELRQLKELPSLKTLKVYDTEVTQQELDKLVAHNPHLELL